MPRGRQTLRILQARNAFAKSLQQGQFQKQVIKDKRKAANKSACRKPVTV